MASTVGRISSDAQLVANSSDLLTNFQKRNVATALMKILKLHASSLPMFVGVNYNQNDRHHRDSRGIPPLIT